MPSDCQRRCPASLLTAPGTVAVLAAMLLLLTARPAEGSKDWLSLHGGGLLANANGASDAGAQFGVAGRGSALIGISDFWGIEIGGGTAYHFSAKPSDDQLSPLDVQHIFAGFRYNIDVFQYVPYLQLAGAAYLPGPPAAPDAPPRSTVGAILTVGVDWRFDRHWSFGALADLHAVSLNFGGFPNYTTVGLNVGYHFRL